MTEFLLESFLDKVYKINGIVFERMISAIFQGIGCKHRLYLYETGPFDFILMASATVASAKLLPNYSLERWFASFDVAIYCDEEHLATKETKYDTSTQVNLVITCRVRQSFKGPYKAGDEITIEYDSVFRRNVAAENGHAEMDTAGKVVKEVPPKYQPLGRALVFLKKKTNEDGYWVSTAKLVIGDKVLQYAQWGNPGPLILVEQKPENLKLDDGQKYGEKELLEDFQLALAKKIPDTKPQILIGRHDCSRVLLRNEERNL